MTRSEAAELWVHDEVTIKRSGAQWTGKVVGFVDEPCMILEDRDGKRTAIVIAGAVASTATRRDAGQ